MLRSIVIFLAGAIIGAPVGAFLWYAFSPLLFDEVVTVQLPGGTYEVQFTAFEVTNGPDLEVWLSAHPDPQSSGDVKGEPFLSLGQLKGNVGDQAYSIPAGTDVAIYPSVVIWCEQFGVLFSPAVLAPPS